MTKAKLLLAILAFLAGINGAVAEEVSVAKAANAAGAWLSRHRAPMGERMNGALQSETASLVADADGRPLFCVVNLEGGGYIVTSGDTRIAPIIAFSSTGEFDFDDANPLAGFLSADMSARLRLIGEASQGRSESRRLLGKSATVFEEKSAEEKEWDELTAARRRFLLSSNSGIAEVPDMRIAPLMKTAWNQTGTWTDERGRTQYSFNRFVPYNYPCGCVATAVAQVMKFWEFPKTSVQRFRNVCSIDGKSVSYWAKGGIYDWDKMPANNQEITSEEECEQLGKLCYDVGVMLGVSWASNGSGAAIHIDNLKTCYGYASGKLVRSEIEQKESIDKLSPHGDVILGSIDGGMPSIIAIDNGKSCPRILGGHAVVVDGYGYIGNDLYCHVNFGWGDGGAWYRMFLDDLRGYTSIVESTLNIHPTETGEVLSGRVTGMDGSAAPFANVTMICPDGSKVAAIANEYGVYHFRTHSEGRYTVAASSSGLVSPERDADMTLDRNSRNNDLILVPSDTAIPASLELRGGDSQACGTTSKYECYGKWPDGSSTLLPVAWSIVDDIDFASIGASSGELESDEMLEDRPVTIMARYTLNGQTVRATKRVTIEKLPWGTPLWVTESDRLYGKKLIDVKPNGCTELNIPEDILCIASGAMSNKTDVVKVTIPPTIANIYSNTFRGCTALEEVSIPSSVCNINDHAFRDCTALDNISLPSSVVSIGNYAFSNCISLTKISLPQGVTSIGKASFCDCKALAEVELTGNLKYLGEPAIAESAFCGCSALSRIVVPEGITKINLGAFKDCTGLAEISLPDSLESIYAEAFCNCAKLKSISIPGGVVFETGMKYWDIFRDCTSLECVRLPPEMTILPFGTFHGCSALREIALPDTVTQIGNRSFADCTNLTSITLPLRLNKIGTSAFMDCPNLTSMEIPDGVCQIESTVFYGCTSLRHVWMPKLLSGKLYNNVFMYCPSDLVLTYYEGKITDQPWYSGRSIATIDAKADSAAVAAAVADIGCFDGKVAGVIGDSAEEFNLFAKWANGVMGGAKAVRECRYAAESYLLGSNVLFDNPPAVDITECRMSGENGEMSLSIVVKDGEIIREVAAEKVKGMFEATEDLGDWKKECVPLTVTIEGSEAGAMHFTVKPETGSREQAFMRIRR